MSILRVERPDVVGLAAPLGVRFFDPLLGKFVGDGLKVTATTTLKPARRVEALVNPSGVHVFHRIPGLAGLSFPDRAMAASYSGPNVSLLVDVVDEQRRFLPFGFEALAPCRGHYELDDAAFSHPSRAPAGSIELFSAPNRSVAPIYACVRADLRLSGDRPAAWALVEARLENGAVFRGLSNEDGRVAIFFAYGEPADLPPGSLSTPVALCPPILEQRWQVELAVYYRPLAPDAAPPESPDRRRLFDQPPAALFADEAHTRPLGPLELQFGRPLVAGSPNVWVKPA